MVAFGAGETRLRSRLSHASSNSMPSEHYLLSKLARTLALAPA